MNAFVAIVRRDLLLAARRKSEVFTALFFFMIVVSLFPLGIGPETALLRRIARGTVGAKHIDFPRGLQGRLRGGAARLRRLLAGAHHATGRIELGRQRGAAGDAVRARLRDARAGGGDGRADLLRVGDQFHQQAVALALPPAGQVRQLAIVRQRRLPAWRAPWRRFHGTA